MGLNAEFDIMKVPNFYTTKDYTLIDKDGKEHIVKIGEYKAIDMPYILKLQQLERKLPQAIAKADVLEKILKPVVKEVEKGTDLSREEFEKMIEEEAKKYPDTKLTKKQLGDLRKADAELNDIKAKKAYYCEKLAQRGLKRYYYKDRKEYKQAAKEDRLTEYLDDLNDIEGIPVPDLECISNIMISLGAVPQRLRKTDKGKQEKKKASKKK